MSTHTTNDFRKVILGAFNHCATNLHPDDFDAWLSKTVNDAECAGRDAWAETQTPADLIVAAWDRAYPIPEGRTIPAHTGFIERNSRDGAIEFFPSGFSDAIRGHVGSMDRRTLSPLPTLIPDDCPAVWASTYNGPERRVLVLYSPGATRHWVAADGDLFEDSDLIDPRPIPQEDSNE